ncbi:MAG: Smr/MutS family protein [Bryobacteraceae bacterium]|nr:Smr/MutS family protein [Bryobacteraceae bacterium]
MDIWSSSLVELDQLFAILRRFVTGPLGRAELERVSPSVDRTAIEENLAETAEAMRFLRGDRLRFGDLPDVTESLARLRIAGAALEAEELYALGIVIGRSSEARSRCIEAGGRLMARVSPLADLRPLARAIEATILPDASIPDDASPTLARLRRERLRQQRTIQETLNRFVAAHRDDGLLQENYVTVRNDRYVVPVAAGKRRDAAGVIHGASSTGQTLYVEPIETIELNNALVRIGEEEAREIHRILRELTDRLRAAGDAIPAAVRVLGELEWIFGKADYALKFDCAIPDFGETLSLKNARHPLLADLLERVVPVTVELDRARRVLLVTGPNTGGKTVAMKTVGLCVLMAQCAIPIPCERATLPVFESVLADIGDNQSVAESLSSFSAHAKRLGDILENATPDTLVLLDELGRATDPEEGGALGVAVVDQLRRAGAWVLASTHLKALKVYGATVDGVINASMGFDENALKPTFQLRVGAPGRSMGLAIAERLGLPAHVIERARESLSTADRDLGRLMENLERQLEAASAREREAAETRAKLEAEHARKLRELERKAEALVAEFETRTAKTVEEVRAAAASRKAEDQARVTANRAQREVRRIVAAALDRPAASAKAELKIEEGVRVRLRGIREIARVRRVLGETVEVESGFVKLQVPLADVVEVLPPGDTAAKLPKNVSFAAGPSWTISERELNLIGKRADEAADEVERFLDRAALASVDQVRIVHGHGMGVLKRTVAETLKNNPHVERFEPQHGATIAYLRA